MTVLVNTGNVQKHWLQILFKGVKLQMDSTFA